MMRTDRIEKEAIRYLGYGRHEVDRQTRELLTAAGTELQALIRPRWVVKELPLTLTGTARITIVNLTLHSRNLARNLRGCERVLLLGATLGSEVDQLMRRYAVTDIARAAVLQALAAASLEEFLDQQVARLKPQYAARGLFLRPRFSPGYGDLDISCQGDILRLLDTPRRIGLSLTAGSMLTPTKSVTAFIGLGRQDLQCVSAGCETCAKTDCEFRRS